MSFTPKIRDYLGEKIGTQYVEGFELWAFIGCVSHKRAPTSDSFIDRWNLAHPNNALKISLNAFDAVDRMVEIWKERFG